MQQLCLDLFGDAPVTGGEEHIRSVRPVPATVQAVGPLIVQLKCPVDVFNVRRHLQAGHVIFHPVLTFTDQSADVLYPVTRNVTIKGQLYENKS